MACMTRADTMLLTQTRGVSKPDLVVRANTGCLIAEHYVEDRDLGSGAYGRVTLVKERKTGVERVCKTVKTTDMTPEVVEMMTNEVALLCMLDHPGIVKIFEYDTNNESGDLMVVLEYLRGGDCCSLLQTANGTPLKESLAATLISQTLMALRYCHSKEVLHRDLKPENIMLVENVTVDATTAECKLVDFGIASAPINVYYGTQAYMAPEIAALAAKSGPLTRARRELLKIAKDYTSQSDMWSLGVTAFELLMNASPFDSTDFLFKYSDYRDLRKKFYHLPLWRRRSEDAHNFVKALLAVDPEQRITAAQALEHPWIQMHRGEYSGLGPELVENLTMYQDLLPVARCCLFAIATRVDVEELGCLGETFLFIDRDGDGKITREELADVLCGLEGGSAIDVDEIAEAADLDHTGGIGFTEFVAACLCSRYVAEDKTLETLMRKTFEALDDERDGKLSLDKIRPYFRERDAPTLEMLPNDQSFGIDEWLKAFCRQRDTDIDESIIRKIRAESKANEDACNREDNDRSSRHESLIDESIIRKIRAEFAANEDACKREAIEKPEQEASLQPAEHDSVPDQSSDGEPRFFSLVQLQAPAEVCKEKGIDCTKRETYLTEADFASAFGMSRSEFDVLKKWRRDELKKRLKLF